MFWVYTFFTVTMFEKFHKLPYGGPGRNRTAVQHAFALKGLQQFF